MKLNILFLNLIIEYLNQLKEGTINYKNYICFKGNQKKEKGRKYNSILKNDFIEGKEIKEDIKEKYMKENGRKINIYLKKNK